MKHSNRGDSSILERGRARRAMRLDPTLARAIRQRACLTEAEVGSLLGVGACTISRWETGRRFPSGNLILTYKRILDRLAGAH